jgi:ribosomal protein S18 acetylase RimI-like enzyme
MKVMEMKIREMNTSDLDAVVKIHQIAFDGFFLTRMGPMFLRAYYQTVLDFKDRIALVSQDDEAGSITGFAVGFRNPHDFYALFRERRKRLIPTILLRLLLNPGLMPDIFRNIRRIEDQAHQSVDAVELSSIAVGEAGKGIGGALLGAFVEKSCKMQALSLFLTTDAHGNDAVRTFYEERGFTFDAIEMRGSRELCRYVRTLV